MEKTGPESGTSGPGRSQRDRFYWRVLDDVLLVVELDRFEFTLLNGSAAFMWLNLVDRPLTLETLACMVGELFDADQARLRADLNSTLTGWQDLGWVTEGVDGTFLIPSRTYSSTPEPYRPISRALFDQKSSLAQHEWALDMVFAGTQVSVACFCDPGLEECDVSVRARTFLSGLPRTRHRTLTPVLLFITHAGVFLRLGDTCVKADDTSDALSRLVLWCFYLAYGTQTFLGTFHAAAVGRPDGAILMPGLSGVGKSTLTAYLVSNDWSYGGDDIVGVASPAEDDPRYVLQPFCSAISVKEPAVPLLEPFFPELSEMPEVAYDTKRARFPAVPETSQMTEDLDPRRIRAIVFPHFSEGSETCISPLGMRETLLALVGIGYRTGERMDAGLLAQIFDFLERTPTYRLDFSDLSAADAVMRDL